MKMTVELEEYEWVTHNNMSCADDWSKTHLRIIGKEQALCGASKPHILTQVYTNTCKRRVTFKELLDKEEVYKKTQGGGVYCIRCLKKAIHMEEEQ